DEKSGSGLIREGLAQLLDDPTGGRMGRNVEMQDTPATVGDDKEAIEHTEGDGRNGKEVHRRDGFPVISKKGKPAFCWLRVSRSSFHPAGNRSFRDIETEHEKFAVNTWGAPGGVLCDHPKDQIADFLGSPSPAHYPAASGNCPPIEGESRSVPTDNRLRAHNDESLFPFGPEPSRHDPEELIEDCQPWSGMLSLQHRELLAKSQVLKQ